ncbi:MAG: hypothetical protein Q4E44_06115 [bacterium]|nr:hypothetical protein [bacterium]
MDRIKKEVDKMTRMPVSPAFSGSNSCRNVNYTGRKEGENEISTAVAKSSSNLAKVPVVVMIAMSPAMLNAKTPIKGLPELEGAKTEYVTALPVETPEIDEMTATPSFNAPEIQQDFPFGEKRLSMNKIQDSSTFVQNGVKYNMVFAADRTDDKEVRYIYIFPNGYNASPTKSLPQVKELIYHDLGSDKEFCGVILRTSVKKENGRVTTYKEMRLPDEIAQKIIDLKANYTEFDNRTNIKYSKIQSANLRQPRILNY